MRPHPDRTGPIGRTGFVACLALAALAGACGDEDGSPTDVDNDGADEVDGTDFAVCSDGLDANFASLESRLFRPSCGSTCHSSAGAQFPGGLDLENDAYLHLLGADGQGAPANNIEGSEDGLRRVVPGNPDASFLMIKLTIEVGNDPRFGSGMPFTDPGSVCPATLATIRQWISPGTPP